MSHDYRVPDYLEKIHSLCEDIQEFVSGITLEEFLRDKRSQNAVAMSLIAIGEVVTALNHKYPEFLEQHAYIPWRYMRGMRNAIAHGYFELDFVVVYETAITSVPELRRQIESLYAKIKQNI